MVTDYAFTLLLYIMTVIGLTILLFQLSKSLFGVEVEDSLQVENAYSYECGFSSFSDASNAFDIKYYLVAILFLLFDLEIALLLPLVVSLSEMGVAEIFTVLLFIGILLIGFFYEWKKGGLDW